MSTAVEENSKSSAKMYFITTLVLAVLGLGVSIYALNHHQLANAGDGATAAACNISSKINCDDVARSEYAEVLGLPLAFWGIVFFLMLGSLAGLGLNDKKQLQTKPLVSAVLLFTGVGVLTSIVLAAISLLDLNVLCPTCSVIYAANLALLISYFAFRKGLPSFDIGSGVSGSVNALIVGAIATTGGYFYGGQASQTPEVASTDKAEVLAKKAEDLPINKTAYSGFGEDFRKGSDNAKVTIIEFADFQCGGCAAMSKVLERLSNKYGNDIRVVFKNYPLDNQCNSSIQGEFHRYACYVASMARCAGRYDKFWEYHDLAFDNQNKTNITNAKGWAKEVGLTDEQITQCEKDPAITEKIKDDIKLANNAGVNATPTLFINGKRYLGRSDHATLDSFIGRLLAE